MVEIKSWEDVDRALAKIGALQRGIGKAADECNAKTAELSKKFAEKTRFSKEELIDLDKAIKAFALSRENEFKKKRSRTLSAGTIKLRFVTLLHIPNTAQTIEALRAAGKVDAIKVTEGVLKSALANFTDAELTSYGMQRKTHTEVIVKPNPLQ